MTALLLIVGGAGGAYISWRRSSYLTAAAFAAVAALGGLIAAPVAEPAAGTDNAVEGVTAAVLPPEQLPAHVQAYAPAAALLLAAVLAAVAVVAWKRHQRTPAVVLASGAAAGTWTVLASAPTYAQLGVLVIAAALLLVGVVRRGRTSAVVTRWRNRTRRTAGVATTLDIVRVAGVWAMRRKAGAVRPHLREVTRWERLRISIVEVAVVLCVVAGMRVYASLEDVVAIFGGPRVGKTGWLAGAIIDHPGAVLTTSTRLDLMKLTRAAREQHGPVHVFNPGGLGDLPSTVRFDLLTGCTDPTTPIYRAGDMIPEAEGSDDRAYWQGQARRVLAALLHAAALGGLHPRVLLAWVADPEGAQRQITSLLRKSEVPAYVQDITQFCKTNDKTRSSITSSIMPALGWLTSPTAVEAATGDGEPLDVAKLLAERGTVYLLGRHEANTAPLLAAFTGHVAREARRLAALEPDGRLDPPPGLFLDEAARVVPVPLPDWTGDFGGSGIFICIAFQSRADIIDRYGPTGAAKILNNSGSIMLFGGTKDTGDLEQWSKLAGDRDEVVKTYGKDGKVTSRSVRTAPVLSVAQLSNLPKGRAVVFSRGMPPAVGRVRMVWERLDIRRPWWWRMAMGLRLRVGSPATPPASSPISSPTASPTGSPTASSPIPSPTHSWEKTSPTPSPTGSPPPSPTAAPPIPAPTSPTREPVGASHHP
jgi:type IV secretion system protein VirD4